MTMTRYFSDRQNGPKPRNEEILSPSVWGGLVALIQSLIGTGAFAFKFPDLCPDGAVVSGTDSHALGLAIQAEMPGLTWPLQTTIREEARFSRDKKPFAPDTLLILDFIEFCYRLVAEPIQGSYHSYFGHYHLSFDPDAGDAGRDTFREDVNRIFERNGIAYELEIDGQIHRLLPPVLGHDLASSLFDTGDATLDQMLEDSRLKFSNRDSKVRREALERLWDSWERLKSLENPKDKRQSITILLDKAADELSFRKLLEEEANALTGIGNSFQIRHSEVTQTAVTDSSHIDYLFHRLFSMIQLLLKKRSLLP